MKNINLIGRIFDLVLFFLVIYTTVLTLPAIGKPRIKNVQASKKPYIAQPARYNFPLSKKEVSTLKKEMKSQGLTAQQTTILIKEIKGLAWDEEILEIQENHGWFNIYDAFHSLKIACETNDPDNAACRILFDE